MRSIRSRAGLSAAALASAVMLLTGCASDKEISEPAVEEIDDAIVSDTDIDTGIAVPLPSAEAKRDFTAVVDNSTRRFYEVGAVETVVVGEDRRSNIYLPNFDRGAIAFYTYLGEGDNGEETIFGEFLLDLEAFSPWRAERVVYSEIFASTYDEITETIEYNVTLTPEGNYVVADDAVGSTTYFVENNLIVGREFRSSEPDSVSGRSFIQYNVGETETDIANDLLETLTEDQLASLFPESD